MGGIYDRGDKETRYICNCPFTNHPQYTFQITLYNISICQIQGYNLKYYKTQHRAHKHDLTTEMFMNNKWEQFGVVFHINFLHDQRSDDG